MPNRVWTRRPSSLFPSFSDHCPPAPSKPVCSPDELVLIVLPSGVLRARRARALPVAHARAACDDRWQSPATGHVHFKRAITSQPPLPGISGKPVQPATRYASLQGAAPKAPSDLPSEQAREDLRRERGRPVAAPPRIPDRAHTPRDRAKDHERNAVAIGGTLAAHAQATHNDDQPARRASVGPNRQSSHAAIARKPRRPIAPEAGPAEAMTASSTMIFRFTAAHGRYSSPWAASAHGWANQAPRWPKPSRNDRKEPNMAP